MDDNALRVLVAGSGFGCRIQIPAFRTAGFEIIGLEQFVPYRRVPRQTAHRD